MKKRVVKLGGSLFRSAALLDVLPHLDAATGQLAIVTGGGAAADVVRDMQAQLKLNELTAHRLALKAMSMNAQALVELLPRGRLVSDPAAFLRVWETKALPVWVPEPMVLDAPDICASWQVTSDSLAAWLARQLGAELLLVKSIAVEPGSTAATLAGAGIVDTAFPEYAAGLSWRAVSAADLANQLQYE
jgi:aspartokinase-like uncharacterized kinase